MTKNNIQQEGGRDYKRRYARLAALQLLYSFEISKKPLEDVIKVFKEEYVDNDDYFYIFDYVHEDVREKKLIDTLLMENIVRGTVHNMKEINSKINDILTDEWKMDRVEIVLLNILRLAIYELLFEESIPSAVTISEYVYLSHVYYEEKEPAFINRILDQVKCD